jgi:epoxyqueuosine reductase QueG
MLNKSEIIEKAYECGFGDIGFTTADPFETQKELLQERHEDYEWAFRTGPDLVAGTDPKQILPQAKTIIVLMEIYFGQAFPASLERHFGMIASALGRIGGLHAEKTVSNALSKREGLAKDEIRAALEKCQLEKYGKPN